MPIVSQLDANWMPTGCQYNAIKMITEYQQDNIWIQKPPLGIAMECQQDADEIPKGWQHCANAIPTAHQLNASRVTTRYQ
jgi:hypothetical protein